MKRILVLLVILGFSLFGLSLYAVQDSNVVWSTYIWPPVSEIFNHPDTNYILVNQWGIKRFAKIDTRTGIIVDSIYNKGMLMGVSKDNKFIYTRGGTLESIKKLDINTYKAVDSIPNIGDASAVNPHFPPGQNVSIRDLKFTSNNQIFVTLQYGKYLIIVLDANNLEIINKKLTHLVSDSLSGAGSISISPKNDICVIQQQYQSFEQVPEPKHWQKTVVWDMQKIQPTNKTLTEESTVGNNFQIFIFSPDGKYFFFRFDKLRIYDTKDFSIFKEMDAGNCIDFSADNKYMAFDSDPELSAKYDSKINFLDYSNFNTICKQKALTEMGTIVLKYSIGDKFIYTCDALNYWFNKSMVCTQFSDVYELKNNRSSTEITVILNNLYVNDRTLLNLSNKFQIINIEGKNVKTGILEINNGQGTININGINSGIYFLTFENISYKFMVVR